MPFWNTDQKLDLLRDFIEIEFDRIRKQNRRNTSHILRVMFRMNQETQAKLDKLLAGSTPALKGELTFGTPIDKPSSSKTTADEISRRNAQAASQSTQKPAVGGPPQRS